MVARTRTDSLLVLFCQAKRNFKVNATNVDIILQTKQETSFFTIVYHASIDRMDSQEEEEEDHNDLMGGCDESKCVARGKSNLFNSSFTCYGDDEYDLPMMCADGLLPVIVEEATDIEGLSYFTCCPPYSTFDATRHCSDPITPEFAIDDSVSGICDDTRKYPRQMKPSEETPTSFVCCDSEANNTSTDFLDDLECVPYRNEFYEPSQVQNKIGKLDVVYCDLETIGFEFARTLDDTYNNDVVSNGGWYQCCKTGPSLPPFAKDKAFNITVYTTIVLFWIAAILSAIVAIGLLIPLLIEFRNKRHRSSSIFGSIFGSRLSGGSSSRPDTSQSGSRRRGTAANPKYSSYNLYLVYLALLDLAFSSYSIWEYHRYIYQTFDPSLYVTIAVSSPSMKDANTPRDEPTIAPYMLGNMWINAFICYEVFVLLRTSHSCRRIKQPSLTKVNLEAGGSCVAAAVIGITLYFLYEPGWIARNDGDFEPLEDLDAKLRFATFSLLIGIPLFYVIGVTILIWWRGYIPALRGASPRKKAMRELAFYFFRIVAVFVGIWIPRGFLIYWADGTGQKWADLVAQYVVAIQPILTTCMILTKSDAKKYIRDLVTLSYLFNDYTCCTKSKIKEVGEEEVQIESAAGTGTGFSHATDEAANAVADGDADSDEGGDDDEAVDSLIFSVLGFRLDDAAINANVDASTDVNPDS